jgi:HK97 family phage prohead protease
VTFIDRFFRRDADVLERREPVALRPVPRTWNRENATFDAVLASATPVERQGFDEVLSVEPGSVKLPASLPVLDTHNRQSLDARLGTIDSLRLEGGQLIGRVVLSKHNERAKRIAAEIEDGHLPSLSIGYRVGKWSERQNNGRRERVAVQWEPLEASLVACPADPNATMRGKPR